MQTAKRSKFFCQRVELIQCCVENTQFHATVIIGNNSVVHAIFFPACQINGLSMEMNLCHIGANQCWTKGYVSL